MKPFSKIFRYTASINYQLTGRKGNPKFSAVNPLTAIFSDTLHSASENPFYQITQTIETIHKIIPYWPGNPFTFLD